MKSVFYDLKRLEDLAARLSDDDAVIIEAGAYWIWCGLTEEEQAEFEELTRKDKQSDDRTTE